jgi:hypothetical protein
MSTKRFARRFASTNERRTATDAGSIDAAGKFPTEEQHMHYAPGYGSWEAHDDDMQDMQDMQDTQDTQDALVLRRRRRWEARYALETAESVRAWMSPAVQLEQAELDRFYRGVLDSLEPRARLAFLMVRELGLSYDDVAMQLCIEKSAVHEHVSAVERRFREELKHIGVEAPGEAGATVETTVPRLRLIRGGLARHAVRPVSNCRGVA